MRVTVSFPPPKGWTYFSRASGATVLSSRPVLAGISQPLETLPPPRLPKRALRSAPPLWEEALWLAGAVKPPPACPPPSRAPRPPPPPSSSTASRRMSFTIPPPERLPPPPPREPPLWPLPRPAPTGPVPRPEPRFSTCFAGPVMCFSRPLGLSIKPLPLCELSGPGPEARMFSLLYRAGKE